MEESVKEFLGTDHASSTNSSAVNSIITIGYEHVHQAITTISII